MKTPNPIELALKEAGLDQRKSNILKTLLKCIEGSPLWLARIFITEPISQKSKKELLTTYNTYAISYNV